MPAISKKIVFALSALVGVGLVLLSFYYTGWDTSQTIWPPYRLSCLALGLIIATASLVTLSCAGSIREDDDTSQSWSHDDITATIDELQEAQDKLVLQEKIVQVGLLTAGIAHEIKNPLNFVTNFSAISIELANELEDILNESKSIEENLKSEMHEIINDLKTNTGKVLEHGKRAESIVMNMLAQARSEESISMESCDVNQLVDEYLNLAYHGQRAQDPNFNISIEKDLSESTGTIKCLKQPFGRVILNIVTNGMYAAFAHSEKDESISPLISVKTYGDEDKVVIKIRDNGEGISEEAMKKIFVPFFTTKPKGKGTGLGLSMSYDIIVKNHHGQLTVDSRVNEYTEFTIVLPRKN